TILGSTGSIGEQALDVLRANPDRFELVGLSANSNADRLAEQVKEFSPRYAALETGDAAALKDLPCDALVGAGAARHLSEVSTDVVLNGIVGFAGLSATIGALQTENIVALANKESLVAGGDWVMELASGGRLVPVDSEHSAIFQCLDGRRDDEVSGLLLTASGGPFFEWERERLEDVEPGDALKHPTWQMGAKITIDSATMMNKGLEVIEAHHLFGVSYDEVKVVVHRQSVVHGGVFFNDGSVVMHAAVPDMRLPIAYGVLYPERIDVGAEPVSLAGQTWTFAEPRSDVFRCLPLAVAAGKAGGPHPAALNAANEISVQAFLEGRIQFLQIPDVIEEVLEVVPEFGALRSLDEIVAVDNWARQQADSKIEARQ
ncbi:MAG: 1-deoxy-D-xylulose-5-phosphate reductoisomerase, partial [Actinomycetota bacterium]|nr:1-deoxy-D-xylulose-5-phosphate reductoisomerase [Actinomycetota bacterium]